MESNQPIMGRTINAIANETPKRRGRKPGRRPAQPATPKEEAPKQEEAKPATISTLHACEWKGSAYVYRDGNGRISVTDTASGDVLKIPKENLDSLISELVLIRKMIG